ARAAALHQGHATGIAGGIHVDPPHHIASIAATQRSGSRDLDRAAMEAVRHWRFHPAQRNGQPVAGSMDIPFEFKPAQ
ncbi:energy transducer TonB, partial [Xanthomonas perforans]|uniref:energy transducer TonB n=1 Tax=Xanthomonas perforans TaxID=442694 RepID=UPI001F438FCD